MIKPVLVANENLSYKSREEYEEDVKKLKEVFKEYEKMSFDKIDEAFLLDFANKTNYIAGIANYIFTYLFVQFHSDTRKMEVIVEGEELMVMEPVLNSKIDTLGEKMMEIGEEKIMNMIDSNSELKVWREMFAQIIRNQVRPLTKEEKEEKIEFENKFNKMKSEGEKLGNKPVVKPFEYEGKKYTNDESTVIAINPNSDREMRKQIFIHSVEDKRDNRKEVEASIAEYANERIKYLKKFGYTSYSHYVAKKRDEDIDFAKNLMLSSKVLYKELYTKFVSKINEYKKEKYNLETVMPWDEKAYPTEIVDIPYQEIIKFYENEVKEIFPKESKYIIDNFSKEGTLAILESEHKYNGAAATWTGKDNVYFVTQSYVSSNPYSASTLAHEMGHTMHIVTSKLNKPIERAKFALAIGEGIADTFSMLFAFASMDKKTPYAKTIAYEALSRLLQVTNTFASSTLAEDSIYEAAWNGKEIVASDIQKFVYKEELEFRPDGKPIIVDGVDLTKKGSTLSYFSINDHYSYSSYTISFIMAIYLADQIRNGNTKAFIEILNMGGEEFSTSQVLEKAGIDISSQEVRDVVIKTAEEITNFIIEK